MIPKREVASQIGRLCLELRRMALSVDNPLLAHLLDVAALEAVNMEVTHSEVGGKKIRRFKPKLIA